MKVRSIALLITFSLFLISIIWIGEGMDGASPLSQVFEFDEDIVFISVGPDDTGSVAITATVRSTSNQDMVYNLDSDLDGGNFWTVEHQNSIYLDSFEEKSITVTVNSPTGEMADTEVILKISVVSENGLREGEDSVTIRVLPYTDSRVTTDESYLMNMPLSGSFEVNIVNTGNIRSPIGIEPKSEGLAEISAGGMIMIEPGDKAFTNIHYDLMEVSSDSETISLLPFIDDTFGESLVVEFLIDGDLVHILFKRGPFLVLLPGPLEKGSVNVISLGGDLSNVGIEPVSSDDTDIRLVSGPDIDLNTLDRSAIEFSAEGFHGIRLMTIRAYGYYEGERITSNAIAVRVEGEREDKRTLTTEQLMYTGGGISAAGAAIIGTIAYFYSASEVFKYKWLLLTFIPLYSTVHGEKVLDHFFRGRLFEYIKENPGITFTALKEHFEVNNGTLTYHLHKLEKEELVVHRNIGKYKLFYVDGVRIKGVEIVISPLDKEIIVMISENPGIPATRIIDMMSEGRSARTISRHLKQLERKGFITSDRRDGTRVIFLSGDMERVLMPRKGVVEVSEITGLDV